MSTKRIVKMIEDSEGRKLLVEVSANAEISETMIQEQGEGKSLFKPVGVKDEIEHFRNSLTQLISDTTSSVLSGINAQSFAIPSKIQLEFGVELGAEGGIWFISKGSINSTLKVSIEWENERKTSGS